jgi:predicted  nucleic acid-binding Zn-ribbon protein
MELTASHAIQGIMVLATIAGGYAVVKSNLSRVMEDLHELIKRFENNRIAFDARLDKAESERAKHSLQIDTLKSINSPKELKVFNREMGEFSARLTSTEKQVSKLENMHNGSHKPTGVQP